MNLKELFDLIGIVILVTDGAGNYGKCITEGIGEAGAFGPEYSNYEGTDMGKDLPPDYFFHNAGLINLTRYMEQNFSSKNIPVNCLKEGGLLL